MAKSVTLDFQRTFPLIKCVGCRVESVTLDFQRTFPLIKCVDCRVEFVLFGILVSENEYTGENDVRYMHQSSVHFCPYCGAKQPKERGGVSDAKSKRGG